MSVYPLVVLLISFAFGVAVFRQYLQRRRPYQLIWTISLAMAAIGSLAYIIFLVGGKSELAFRLYYICGALLTAPLLGMGSLMLVARSEAAQRRAYLVLAVVVVLSAIGAVLLLTNPINQATLHALNGGPGTDPDVYKAGAWKAFVVVLNIFGGVAVIAVALYSGWQLWRRNISGRLVAANVLIALGTYVISQAGGQARTGLGAGFFWLTMAVGWVVLFGGFLLTFRLHQGASAGRQSTSAVAGTRA